MRNIISQITALWDICRRDRKPTGSAAENPAELNPAVLSGRTWRPWVSARFGARQPHLAAFRSISMH